jgi:hypothetical protein
MIWAWVSIAAIGMGLPAAAWRLGRNPRVRPLSQSPGRHADPIDRYLFDQYGLGVLDRFQVRQAVLAQGHRPGQASLRAAGDGLAAEVLSGRLRPPRPVRWFGWVYISLGLLLCAAGIADLFLRHTGSAAGGLVIAEGVTGITAGVAVSVYLPKQIRRKARRALGQP